LLFSQILILCVDGLTPHPPAVRPQTALLTPLYALIARVPYRASAQEVYDA